MTGYRPIRPRSVLPLSHKPDLRWQLLLAGIAALLIVLLLALSWLPSLPFLTAESAEPTTSTPSLTATRAPSGNLDVACVSSERLTPQEGGLMREGMVGVPRYLNPLLSDGNPVDEALVNLLFDGLTRYDNDGRLVGALAEGWQVSEDGLTVTFTLRPGLSWHDGEPLTAVDIAFTYGLLQSPSFPLPLNDKPLWEAVEINVLNEREISFTLPSPYAPFLSATTRGILPAHLLGNVSAGELPTLPFNVTPVGSGPFMVGNNWQQEGALLLLPNPQAWPVPPYLDGLLMRFLPDETALLEAYMAGELDAVRRLSPTAVDDALVLPQMRLYTTPRARYAQLLFNQTEDGHPALRDRAIRRALSQALDKQALLDASLNGQGIPFEGPYLPQSLAYTPNLPLDIPPNPEEAGAQLTAAGWTLPEGATVRRRPSGEEGAEEGAEEETLSLTLLAYDTPANRALVEQITAQWAAVGVELFWSLTDDLPTFAASLQDRAFDVALVDITPAADPDLYDFWSQEAILDGQNYAGWNRRRASEALEAARQVWNQDERRAYYEAFLTFFEEDRPAVTLFQYVDNYGIGAGLQAVEMGEVYQPRDRYATFANWFWPEECEEGE